MIVTYEFGFRLGSGYIVLSDERQPLDQTNLKTWFRLILKVGYESTWKGMGPRASTGTGVPTLWPPHAIFVV